MKTLSLIAVVAVSLLSGCDSNSCTRNCEKDYEECVDGDRSEDECQQIRSRCEDKCAEDFPEDE